MLLFTLHNIDHQINCLPTFVNRHYPSMTYTGKCTFSTWIRICM